MAELTDRLDVLSEKVFDILTTNQEALGLEDIWMGDQDRVPRVPAAAVEPGPKTREWSGAPRRTRVTLDVYVLLYLEVVTGGIQRNVRESARLSEEVEAVLHADATLGGLVISSFVVENAPGYATREKTMMRASRMVLRSTSQIQLPMVPEIP